MVVRISKGRFDPDRVGEAEGLLVQSEAAVSGTASSMPGRWTASRRCSRNDRCSKPPASALSRSRTTRRSGEISSEDEPGQVLNHIQHGWKIVVSRELDGTDLIGRAPSGTLAAARRDARSIAVPDSCSSPRAATEAVVAGRSLSEFRRLVLRERLAPNAIATATRLRTMPMATHQSRMASSDASIVGPGAPPPVPNRLAR
jgi:hypothetical protein